MIMMGSSGGVPGPVGLLGVAAAHKAGSKLGEWAGGGEEKAQQIQFGNPSFLKEVNGILIDYVGKAINEVNQGTNKGVGSLQEYLGKAEQSLTQNTQKAIDQAAFYGNQGFQQSQALQSPYNMAGLTALDAYMDSMGLSRPQQGSQAVQQGLFNAAQAKPYLEQLQAMGAPTDVGAAPTMGQAAAVTPEQIEALYQSSLVGNQDPRNRAPGAAVTYFNNPLGGQIAVSNWHKSGAYNNSAGISQAKAASAQYLQQQAQAAAQAEYDKQQQAYQAAIAKQQQQAAIMNQIQKQIGLTPQQQQMAGAYNQGMFNKPTGV